MHHRSQVTSRRRTRLVVCALTLALTLVVTACADTISGQATSGIPPLAPDAKLSIQGSTSGDFDRLAKNALTDIESFWQLNYPSISGGKSLSALKGRIYSVDDTAPAASAYDNSCISEAGIKIVEDNAFYCSLDDSIAYDRVGLIPKLAKQYGPYFVAAMFAHEFGHAVQARLGIMHEMSSIAKETQADCAAGAFTAWVMNFKSPHIRVTQAALDQVLVGYIQLRDPEPHSDSDSGTHGNGFDRVGAFATGINDGVQACFSDKWADRAFTERGYTSDTDYSQGGNQPMSQVLNPAPATPSGGGGGGLEPDLNQFWRSAAKSIGKEWVDVKIAQATHPPCATRPQTQFAYCPSDNTVYYSTALAQKAYQSGDFSLGTLLAYGWGLAVRSQLFDRSLDDSAALLGASCYTGAYAASVNVPASAARSDFSLSPSDMDEATTAVLAVVATNQALGERGTTGLTRITAFNKGYFGGLSAC
ncbi:Predicted metalloprotease [Frankineae bacterium MT45]|nr:Predicted metalloprotease [Frankineae bacterium MT45]